MVMHFRASLMCLAFAATTGPAQAESLRAAVQAALTESPDVLAENAGVRASAFELQELRREYLPSFSLFGDVGFENVDNPKKLSPSDNNTTKLAREIGIEGEITLFDGYRRANLVYANSARLDGSILGLLDASETLGLRAVEAYVDVLRHRLLEQVARENVARHVEIGAQVQQAVDGGRLPASDAFEAESRILATRLALVRVREAAAESAARYTRVIGRAPSGAMSLPPVRSLPTSLQAFQQRAQTNSFRVKLANSAVNQSQYEQNVVESDRQPQLSLNAGVSTGADLEGSSGRESDAYIGLRVFWTFYQGGRTPQSKALLEQTQQALSERNKVVRDVREMAEKTWASYLADLERARLLGEQVTASEEVARRYEEEVRAGKRKLLDLLEAERRFFNVRFQKVSVDAAVAFNQFRILATQSDLANFFDLKPANMVLEARFEERARENPTAVFDVEIPPLQ